MMTSVAYLDEAARNEIIQRLKRIEGQARGIQRMIEEERDCQDILNQMAAMRAASHTLSMYLLEAFVQRCLLQSTDSQSLEQTVTRMVNVISKLTR